MDRIAATSPRSRARIAGVFYLLTFVTGSMAALFVGHLASLGDAAGLLATFFYVVVIVLFYALFRVVNRSVALLALVFGLVGCLFGALTTFHAVPFHINSLVFFGFYCLLTGYLIVKSTFLPQVLGFLMAFAGIGWLTFASASLAHSLAPFNAFPGLLGEGSLTLWLLIRSINPDRWNAQAADSGIEPR